MKNVFLSLLHADDLLAYKFDPRPYPSSMGLVRLEDDSWISEASYSEAGKSVAALGQLVDGVVAQNSNNNAQVSQETIETSRGAHAVIGGKE